jgi:hypothetical protein
LGVDRISPCICHSCQKYFNACKNWQEVILHHNASSHPTMVGRHVSSAHLGWCAGRLPAVCRNPIGAHASCVRIMLHSSRLLSILELLDQTFVRRGRLLKTHQATPLIAKPRFWSPIQARDLSNYFVLWVFENGKIFKIHQLIHMKKFVDGGKDSFFMKHPLWLYLQMYRFRD